MSQPDDELLARAKARVGTVLRGKYTLDRVLGVGGMASVYVATHRNKKRFAVKVLHPELSLRTDIRTRFVREGYAANSVEHPGTVVVLDDDVADDGGAFLVMELLEGETVEERWERSGHKLAPDVVLSIGHQLLDVLASAHAHGVVHRDIKPANLFLTRDGRLKVLDFGIARVRDAASSHATQTGAMMGTPAFMAPEQALGKTSQIDALTDVWAVGATLFTLASGRLVHEGESPQAMMVQAATRPAPSLATLLPGLPPVVVEIVDRALAFEREARWPSAAAMRDAIRDGTGALLARLSPAQQAATDAPFSRTLASEPGSQPEPPTRLIERPALVRGLTTAQPVSSDGTRTLRRPGRWRPSLRLAVGAGVAALLAVIVLIFLVGGHPSADGTSTAASSKLPLPVTPPAPATTAPTIAVTDLPTVALAPPASVPRPALPSKVSPASPPPTPQTPPIPVTAPPSPPRSSCNPPYTLDPKTGSKRWKAECL